MRHDGGSNHSTRTLIEKHLNGINASFIPSFVVLCCENAVCAKGLVVFHCVNRLDGKTAAIQVLILSDKEQPRVALCIQ